MPREKILWMAKYLETNLEIRGQAKFVEQLKGMDHTGVRGRSSQYKRAQIHNRVFLKACAKLQKLQNINKYCNRAMDLHDTKTESDSFKLTEEQSLELSTLERKVFGAPIGVKILAGAGALLGAISGYALVNPLLAGDFFGVGLGVLFGAVALGGAIMAIDRLWFEHKLADANVGQVVIGSQTPSSDSLLNKSTGDSPKFHAEAARAKPGPDPQPNNT